MTELSFLIDLLLNHKLQKATKDLIAERIQSLSRPSVTTGYANIQAPGLVNPILGPSALANQAPSMQAIMSRNPDLVPTPVVAVAQTQATAAAMASRNQAIAESISGKVDKVSGRPRKF